MYIFCCWKDPVYENFYGMIANLEWFGNLPFVFIRITEKNLALLILQGFKNAVLHRQLNKNKRKQNKMLQLDFGI